MMKLVSCEVAGQSESETTAEVVKKSDKTVTEMVKKADEKDSKVVKPNKPSKTKESGTVQGLF